MKRGNLLLIKTFRVRQLKARVHFSQPLITDSVSKSSIKKDQLRYQINNYRHFLNPFNIIT